MNEIARAILEVAMTAVLATWSAPTTEAYQSGKATYYSYGLMEIAAKNQGYYLPPGYKGFVAVNRKADKGRTVVLFINGKWDGPYFAADCSGFPDDYLLRLRQNRVIELSAEAADKHGFYGVGPWPVVVIIR